MSRSKLPAERVRGQQVLMLGKLLHHLGAPFPHFFQETGSLSGIPLVGVIVTGIPLDRSYYVEYTAEWRTSDDYGPLQEAAHRAIHAIRAHFSDHLRGSQFGGVPAMTPGGLGLQFGPSVTTSYPYPPLSPATAVLRQDTTETMLMSSTMLYDSTQGALARAEESVSLWQQRCHVFEVLQENRYTSSSAVPPYPPTYPPSDPDPSFYAVPPTVPPPAPPVVPPTVPPTVSPSDPPIDPVAPPPYPFYSFIADGFTAVPPTVPVPDPSYEPFVPIPSPPYPYPHVPTPPSQGDLGDPTAPPPECPLPHRLRQEFRGPPTTVPPDPVRDTTLIHEAFRTYFGDSSSPAVGGGASPSQGSGDSEESDPEEW